MLIAVLRDWWSCSKQPQDMTNSSHPTQTSHPSIIKSGNDGYKQPVKQQKSQAHQELDLVEHKESSWSHTRPSGDDSGGRGGCDKAAKQMASPGCNPEDGTYRKSRKAGEHGADCRGMETVGDDNPVSRECWRSDEMHISVSEHPGQLLQVQGVAQVNLPAQQLFALITHPTNERIFRHLETCENRQVVQEGGWGDVTVVESVHVASWKCFMLAGTLRTRLRVEQRPQEGVVHFTMLPTGSRFQLLRHFEGWWRVMDGSADTGTEGCAGSQRAQHTLLSLEQQVQPSVYLPPPLGVLLKSIASRQLRGFFGDLQSEAACINNGKPSLWES